MEQTIVYLGFIGIILLIGIICTAIARKLKLPSFMFLLIVGIVLGNITIKGKPIIYFDSVFLASLAILTLALVIFEASSKFKLKEFDILSWQALKLTMIFFVFLLFFLSIASKFIFPNLSWPLAILFSAAMIGSTPPLFFVSKKIKVFRLLEVEAILNTPLGVVIPFLIADFLAKAKKVTFFGISAQLTSLVQQYIVAIGVGMLLGIIIFKLMQKAYRYRVISQLVILTAAILTYVIAELFEGSGVFAVTTMGLFFGNVYITHKRKLLEFSETLSYILEIIVFIMIGFTIKISFTPAFIARSLLLFGIFILIRYIVVNISFRKGFTELEKIFISLNAPKGIAVAALVFSLALKIAAVPDLNLVLDLILVTLFYSVILSTIVVRLSKYFIKVEVTEEEQIKEPKPKSKN